MENAYSVIGNKFYFGDSYEFDSITGTFKLINTDGSSVITDTLSDDYKNYYTCGGVNVGAYTSCSTIYRVAATNVEGTTYTITQGDEITSNVAMSIRSEIGLYKTEDDYGASYVFRGDVNNNNVSLGGYYWKIIRTNGDNSIRLIYNGTTPNATGSATSINNAHYAYNIGNTDPTFVGYMYGKNFTLQKSTETTYSNIGALIKYYFSDSFTFDETNEVFKLKTTNLEPISKTISEMNEIDEATGKKLYELYPYTCLHTSSTESCNVLTQVNGVVSEVSIKVQHHSYSSKDKESTRTNELSSNVKTQLENWYKTNIVGKKDENNNLITDYIVDQTFCNDRSTPNPTYSSGYLLSSTTLYGANIRLTASNITTTLKCSTDIRDQFSSTTSKGNGSLTYPVALITADEVALAGGHYGSNNENFYLRTNDYYWTMTPADFNPENIYARVWHIYPNGALMRGNNVLYGYSARAVINLRSDVLISSGDGSVENPFQLKLA